jgi:hypothetical protein
MALNDYLEDKVEVTEEFKGVPFRMPEKSNATLATVDSDMEQARKAAQIRGRREAIQKQIDNLESQNAELRARLETVKKGSLSDMDEDKIVAMAKAKGIKNEDIDAWLKGRAQRSARKISGRQTEEQRKISEELNQQNKDADVQAIYDAYSKYSKALDDAKLSEDEAAVTKNRIVLAAKNELDTRKRNFQRRYGESWEEFTGEEEQTTGAPKSGKVEDKEKVEVVLTDDEAKVVDETTMQKFNEPDTTNKEKRAIKAEAQKKIRKKGEADKARKEQLDGIKKDLAIIGAASGKDAARIIRGFDKSKDSNDPVKVKAVTRIKAFIGKDKDFREYGDLDKLFVER